MKIVVSVFSGVVFVIAIASVAAVLMVILTAGLGFGEYEPSHRWLLGGSVAVVLVWLGAFWFRGEWEKLGKEDKDG